MNIGKTGKSGEDRVAGYLKQNGAFILKRNYACRFGEIDIIAQLGEYILFVEVKTRREGSMVSGEQAVDFYKQNRIMLTAKDYISKTECQLQPRFDVAVVTVYQKPDKLDGYRLNYIKNAF